MDIRRYPASGNASLRAWSAADEHLLEGVGEAPPLPLAIYGDRFGFLACHLAEANPFCIADGQSQRYSIRQNAMRHQQAPPRVFSPLDEPSEKAATVLLRIPKSLDLYHLYLRHILRHSHADVVVKAAFMTRHFSPQLLEIASLYFESVTQSRAWKKSRILHLEGKKALSETSIIDEVPFGEGPPLRQYWGVFSAGQVDWATRFLLSEMQLPDQAGRILDLACGNGVIGRFLQQRYPRAELHLLDDSYLAIASAKMNLRGENTHFHHAFGLEDFEDGTFDFVAANPPFHSEHEVDISLPLRLFRQVARCLKKGGRFQLVANRHLNYLPHLRKMFGHAEVLAQNAKFVVYKAGDVT